MPPEQLPRFKYHPDPVKTGSIQASSAQCVCCGRSRGFIYTGPVYAIEEYEECICPWCIADGSAHEKLDATFHDETGIGGGEWDTVLEEVIEEIAFRTPGFNGWQQEQWWSHCDDAAQFLGRAGRAELAVAGPQAIAAMKNSIAMDGSGWDEFFAALDKDGSPTAYLFKCIKCGQFGGYQDCD